MIVGSAVQCFTHAGRIDHLDAHAFSACVHVRLERHQFGRLGNDADRIEPDVVVTRRNVEIVVRQVTADRAVPDHVLRRVALRVELERDIQANHSFLAERVAVHSPVQRGLCREHDAELIGIYRRVLAGLVGDRETADTASRGAVVLAHTGTGGNPGMVKH